MKQVIFCIEVEAIQLSPSSSGSLRNFGINLVGNVPWGSHLCQLYETEQDLYDILVPYFVAGLQNNELCLWVVSPPLTFDSAVNSLRHVFPELDQFITTGQIEFDTSDNWYGKPIIAEKATQKVIEKIDYALKQGFEGLRVAGNISNAEKRIPNKIWKNCLTYERVVNAAISFRKVLALCVYPLKNCTGSNIVEIERHHANTLIKRGSDWFLVEDAGKSQAKSDWYHNLIQTSIDSFWIIDLTGQFLEVNNSYCKLVGYRREELLSMKMQDVEVNETPDQLLRHINRIVKKEKEIFETCHRAKSGRIVNVEVSANYLPAEGGKVFAFAHDITRRKRNEEAIIQSEVQYRELADSIADSFVGLDSHLCYTYWNRASEKITGIQAKDVMGKNFFDVFKRDAGTEKVAKIYLNVLKTQKPEVFVDELSFRGKKCIVENHVYPSRKGISVFSKDVTQRRELQRKLEIYAQSLEDLVKLRTERLRAAERLATIGEVAGMVGHDIRNPLQSLSGELYLARNAVQQLTESQSKQDLTESLCFIGEQLSYINKIVADLQDYAKAPIPAISQVDLKSTIDDVLSEVYLPQEIKVVIYIEDDFPPLETDVSYIKRILTNLITNAMQAMPEGGTLTLSANYNPKIALISVQDTGAGITVKDREKIFAPLFTTKSKGQGFGLAVVKKLTQALDGNITFESTPGKGTKFTLELPIVAQQ